MSHKHSIRVYYEDTDFAGIVYHANYLKFIERARTELLISLGISQKKINLLNQGYFVVKKINANYLKPAYFEDDLTIISSFMDIKFTSFEISQQIFRKKVKIFQSRVLLAYLERGHLCKMPETLKKKLTRF
tara:strand:- start:596 stop:988 length:393 start_codon:yes stop_codon:yes gene_type:complete